MTTTTMSSKGQIVLPAEIRQRLHWDAGTRLVVEETADGVVLKKAAIFPPTTIEDVFGCLKYDGPPKTLSEMDEAITEMIKERHARGRY